MASLSQVRQRVDTFVSNVWPVIQSRQDAYFATHGRYWQGLKTHTIAPNHTDSSFADSAPDRMDAKPTDQTRGWRDVLNEVDTSIPAALTIDAYESPAGHGYVATLDVQWNGVTYQRSANVGPESTRTTGWQRVVEDDEVAV